MRTFTILLSIFLLYGFVVELRDGVKLTQENLLFDGDHIYLNGTRIYKDSVKNIYIVEPESSEKLISDEVGFAFPDTFLLRLANEGKTKYPDFPGIVLVDWGKSILTSDEKQVFIYHFAGKILNEKQLEWAKRQLYFEEGRNKITLLFGRTIKDNGEVYWLTDADIKIFTPPQESEFFDVGKYLSFTLPNVSVGSIVEFAYIDSLYNPEIPEFFFVSFYFQDYLPVMLSRFEVSVPSGINLHYKEYNFDRIDVDFERIADGGSTVYMWEVRDVSPVEEENQMPALGEIVPSVRGTTVENWDIIFDIISEFQRQRMEISADIESLANRLVKGCKTDSEKVDRLYRFVQDEIEYISVKSSFSSGETGHHWRWTLEHKMGDCTDKSILLSSLLNAIGLVSAPVVIMTNDEENVDRTIPNLDGNHAIVKLIMNNKTFFLDPTSTTHKFPFFRSDDYGVSYYCPLFRETGIVPVPPAQWNRIDTYIDGKLSKTGNLRLKYVSHPYGNMEADYRYWWATENPSDYKNIFEQWVNDLFPGSKLVRWNIPDPLDLDKPFFESFEIEIPNFTSSVDNMIILYLPHLEKDLDFRESSTPERKYPIKYGYPILKHEKIELEIPKEWKILEIPDSVSLSTKWATFNGKFAYEKNKLIVEYTYQRDSLYVAPNEYQEYKKFLKSIRRFAKNAILLEKKRI